MTSTDNAMATNKLHTSGPQVNKEKSLEDLPPETLTFILRQLKREHLIKTSAVSHVFNNIIRCNIGFDRLSITQSDVPALKGSPLLKNTYISCSYMDLSPDELCCLSGVKSISLVRTNITDSGILALLQGGKHTIHTINLSQTQITDASLIALRGVHTIDIIDCLNISEEGIKALKDVHDITLSDLKDSWLKHLSSVNTLSIYGDSVYGSPITDDGVKSLTNVKKLSLHNCFKITDSGLEKLINLEHLTLDLCRSLTSDCLKDLTSLKTLSLGMDVGNKFPTKAIEALGITNLIVL